MSKRIPALTLSGGKLSEFGGLKAVKEFRVWVHPKAGDVFYYVYRTHAAAKSGQKLAAKQGRAEKPIAVVWDIKHGKYREVMIDKLVPKTRRKKAINLMTVGLRS